MRPGDGDVSICLSRGKTGERKEDVLFDADALPGGEGETWRVGRGAFREIGLWTEGRLNLRFGKMRLLGERDVTKRIEDVVAGVSFVACQLECLIDREGEAGVDLNGAVGIALEPAEGTPGLVVDEGERDGFICRKAEVGQRLLPADSECGGHDGREAVRRDEKSFCVVAIGFGGGVRGVTGVRQQSGDASAQEGAGLLLAIGEAFCLKENARFAGEVERVALEHGDAGVDGLKLPSQKVCSKLLLIGERHGLQLQEKLAGRTVDCGVGGIALVSGFAEGWGDGGEIE